MAFHVLFLTSSGELVVLSMITWVGAFSPGVDAAR